MSETLIPDLVRQDVNGEPRVRTVVGRQIVAPLLNKEHKGSGELAPESQALFEAALDVMQCRETATSILDDEINVISLGRQDGYMNALDEDNPQQEQRLAA